MRKHTKSDGHPLTIDVLKAGLVLGMNEADPNNQSWHEFTVERDGDVPLMFDGISLGKEETSVNALDRFRNMWVYRGHTAEIFKTQSGKFVVAFVSWSQVSTEVNRYKVVVASTPAELYDGLASLTTKGIPDAALLALRKAAMADRALKEIAVERI